MKTLKNLFFIICVLANFQDILAMDKDLQPDSTQQMKSKKKSTEKPYHEMSNKEKKQKKLTKMEEALSNSILNRDYENIAKYCQNKSKNNEKIGLFIRIEKQHTFFEKFKRFIFDYPYKEWDLQYPESSENNNSVSQKNKNLSVWVHKKNEQTIIEIFKQIKIPTKHSIEITREITANNDISSPYWPNNYAPEINGPGEDKIVKHAVKTDLLTEQFIHPKIQHFNIAKLAATVERFSSPEFKELYRKHLFKTRLIYGLGLLTFGGIAYFSSYGNSAFCSLSTAATISSVLTLLGAKKYKDAFVKQEMERIENRATTIYQKAYPNADRQEIKKLKKFKLDPYINKTWNTQSNLERPITVCEVCFNEE